MEAQVRSVPWHLWVVGLVSLLWNAFGGYDYLMTQTGDRAYIGSFAESMGVGVDEALAYFDSFPVWMAFAWAVGVWGSVAGSVLLLLRSRFAYHAFVLSLLGLVVAMPWQLANPMPGSDTSMTWIMTGVIALVLVLLIAYSRAMLRNRVLR